MTEYEHMIDTAWGQAERAAHAAVAPVETLVEFESRIRALLDAHFAKFKPVIDAINAGFARTP